MFFRKAGASSKNALSSPGAVSNVSRMSVCREGQRMADKVEVISRNEEVFEDIELDKEELIAYILSTGVPIQRAADVAYYLSKKYPSVTELLSEDPRELRKSTGVCEEAVGAIKVAYSIHVRTLREILRKNDFSENLGVVRNYCECLFQPLNSCVAKAFFFQNGRMVLEGAIDAGSISEISILPREIVRSTILADANEVFIAFGRKFGSPDLRKQEAVQVERLKLACNALDIGFLGAIAVVTARSRAEGV